MTESSNSSNPSPLHDDFIDQLAWLSVLYGAVLGMLYALLTLKWFPASSDSLTDAITTLLMLAASVLNGSQLPIGIGILQRQRWAAIAAYYTSLALVVLGMLSLPLAFQAGTAYLVLPIFPFSWGLYSLSLLRSSDEIQELFKRKS